MVAEVRGIGSFDVKPTVEILFTVTVAESNPEINPVVLRRTESLRSSSASASSITEKDATASIGDKPCLSIDSNSGLRAHSPQTCGTFPSPSQGFRSLTRFPPYSWPTSEQSSKWQSPFGPSNPPNGPPGPVRTSTATYNTYPAPPCTRGWTNEIESGVFFEDD